MTDTICPYCGVGCTLSLARPGQPDRQGDLADGRVGHDGHLCVKGRFGFEFVQVLPKGSPRA